MIVYGGYVWVYFTDWTPDRANRIGVARAPAASATNRLAYRKWDGAGGWTPGIRGKAVGVIGRPTIADGYAAGASVSWNPVLNRFLAVYETDKGFSEATSTNLKTWTQSGRLFAFPTPISALAPGDTWYRYPTLIRALAPDGRRTDAGNYLYFAKGTQGGAPHTMVRVYAGTALPSTPAGLALVPGATFTPTGNRIPFGWVCTGDVAARVHGVTVPLYDSDAATGLVLGLEPGSELVTVVAPYGASCQPVLPDELAAALDTAATQLAATGCGGAGCAAVRTVVYDQAGRPETGELPDAFTMGAGESWTPDVAQSAFVWTCTGDVSTTVAGVKTDLFDSDATTGVVVGLAPSPSLVAITAPYGASCRPARPDELTAAVTAAVSEALDTGCAGGTGCAAVREVVYDSAGAKVIDEWH